MLVTVDGTHVNPSHAVTLVLAFKAIYSSLRTLVRIPVCTTTFASFEWRELLTHSTTFASLLGRADYMIHRYAEWMMLMLGEGILSLEVVHNEGYYLTAFFGISTMMTIATVKFGDEPHGKHHAMWQGLKNQLSYSVLTQFLSLSLIAFGGEPAIVHRIFMEVSKLNVLTIAPRSLLSRIVQGTHEERLKGDGLEVFCPDRVGRTILFSHAWDGHIIVAADKYDPQGRRLLYFKKLFSSSPRRHLCPSEWHDCVGIQFERSDSGTPYSDCGRLLHSVLCWLVARCGSLVP